MTTRQAVEIAANIVDKYSEGMTLQDLTVNIAYAIDRETFKAKWGHYLDGDNDKEKLRRVLRRINGE